MRTQRTYYKYLLVLLLPAGILLNYLSSLNGQMTERLYSDALYKVFSPVTSRITGVFPFSLAEIAVVALALFTVWRLGVFCVRMVRERSDRLKILGTTLMNALAFVGVIYFFFILLWGFNYNRLSFSQISGLEVKPAPAQELADLSKKLIDRANILRTKVKEDPEGVMVPEDNYRAAFQRAYKGYDRAAELYPQLRGSYGPPKPVLLSKVMSYTSIWGVYFPFTVEPNVNIDIPKPYLLPTACHEMAHQRGFAREDEANYIAYLTCSLHPDPDFQYSGTLWAATYCMDALYSKNRELFNKLWATYGEGIKRDLQAIRRFHEQHESPLQDFSSNVNDLYLKANRQDDGEQSYGRMVDLLLAEHRASIK